MHTDHLGTPQTMTDSSRNIVWKGDYKPFGEVNEVVGAVDNNFRFPGQYYDAESGLYYNWNRYYLAGIGRYLTADPIGLDGGLNLYGYVTGNPINFVDLAGLNTLTDTFPWDSPWEWPKVKPNPGILGGCIGAFVSILCSPTELNDVPEDKCKDDKWMCEGPGKYEIIGENKHVIEGKEWFVAYGKTKELAKEAWTKMVSNAAPKGQTARHIKPKHCKKIR